MLLREFKPLFGPGFLAGLLGLQLFFGPRVVNSDVAFVMPPATQEQGMGPLLFKTLSFGHWPAGVDWLWIRTIGDPQIEDVAEGVHPPAYFHLNLMTQLDPVNFDAYYYGSNILAIIRHDVDGALEIVQRGIDFIRDPEKGLSTYPESFRKKYWSQPYHLPIMLGYIYWFERDNYPKAAEAFQLASTFEGAPRYARGLAEKLKTPKGQYESGLRVLESLARSQKDPAIQKNYQEKFDSLRVGYFLYEINQEWRKHLGSAKRNLASQSEFERFVETVPKKDPLGGEIYLDQSGKILSRTERKTQFGLEY